MLRTIFDPIAQTASRVTDLRFWQSFLSKLRGRDIHAPPWKFSDEPGKRIAVREAPPSAPMILPLLYGRDEFPAADGKLPEHHEPKALELTEYRDVALIQNNIVLNATNSHLIPPTFSRNRRKFHDGVRYLPEEKVYVTRYPVDVENCLRVDSPVYYTDTEAPSVYGHVLIETMTRLWALHEVPKDVPIVTSVMPGRTLGRMLSCLGVSLDRVLHIDRPIIARSGLFPTMAVARRDWVHPAAWEIFHRLKTLALSSDISSPERIFISRSRVLGRDLLNQGEVETYFKSQGFVVVHPQDLPIEDQVKLFSSAKLVAGVAGSAMLNCVFADSARILMLCSEGWLTNSHTLLSQKPGRLGYVFGKPVDALEKGHRTTSPWRIHMNDVVNAAERHLGLREVSIHSVRYRTATARGNGNELPPLSITSTPSWSYTDKD